MVKGEKKKRKRWHQHTEDVSPGTLRLAGTTASAVARLPHSYRAGDGGDGDDDGIRAERACQVCVCVCVCVCVYICVLASGSDGVHPAGCATAEAHHKRNEHRVSRGAELRAKIK